MSRFAATIFIGALVVVVLLFAFRPPDSPGEVATPAASQRTSAPSATPSAVTVPTACATYVKGMAFASGTLAERSSAAQAWMEANPGRQAWVVITDNVLTEVAARQARSQPVRDVRIAIERAGFRLGATAVAIGSFPIKVLLVPQVSNGTIRFDLRELDTDGLPGFFRGSIEDSIRKAADPAGWGLRMRIDGIATDSGCAVVWGSA